MAILKNITVDEMVCYSPTMITTNGIWQGDNPLDYALPLFILQVILVVVATRIFVFVLKPIRQPRVIAEILVSFFHLCTMHCRRKMFTMNHVYTKRLLCYVVLCVAGRDSVRSFCSWKKQNIC